MISDDGDFTSSIRFYDPQYTAQPNLFATNFRINNAVPHLVLKNTTDDVVTAQPKFRPTSGESGNPIELSAITLGPRELAEVDLSPLVAAAKGRPDINSVSVQVVNNRPPGSLIGALYSTDVAGTTYDVPLRDSGPMRNSTGAYPWRIDDDYSTVVSITNVGTTPSEFTVQIHFEGGKYVLNPRVLAGGETAAFDMRKIIDEQKRDNTDRALPRSIKSGQFRWAIRGDGSSRLVGRSEMISVSKKVSSSYSCAYSCPPSYYSGEIRAYQFGGGVEVPSHDLFLIELDGEVTASGMTWQWDQDSFGSMYGPYEVMNSSWMSHHPNLAGLVGFGTYQGYNQGETTAEAHWNATSWYLDGGLDECVSYVAAGVGFAAIRIGFLSYHAYELYSETFTGGRYGSGITEWTPTCIGPCSYEPKLRGDKLYSGTSPRYIQCRSIRIYGFCFQPGLKCYLPNPTNHPGFCSPL